MIVVHKLDVWSYWLVCELTSFVIIKCSCCLNCTVFRLQLCQEMDMHTFGMLQMAANYMNSSGNLQRNIGLEIAGEFTRFIALTVASRYIFFVMRNCHCFLYVLNDGVACYCTFVFSL